MITSKFNNLIQKTLLCLIVYCITLFFAANILYSQTKKDVSRQPLHIVSDKMIAQKDSSMVEFLGNVKVTQQDSTILADSIKIYPIDDKTKDETQADTNIKKIISTGNVEYISEDRKAFADKAVYTTIDDILILTGKSPKLITGSSFVTGKKITLYQKGDKVLVESDSSKRVEALFNPEDNVQDKE
ncbi:hypothetical protein KAJ27_20100 [bacterium]|nr:hypothetical protein [bacterium]